VTVRFVPICAIAIVLGASGCGGGSKSSSGTTGTTAASTGGHLVTKVQHASAKVDGGSVVATVKVTEGGKPGEHLTRHAARRQTGDDRLISGALSLSGVNNLAGFEIDDGYDLHAFAIAITSQHINKSSRCAAS
jgi:hypothetical protein